MRLLPDLHAADTAPAPRHHQTSVPARRTIPAEQVPQRRRGIAKIGHREIAQRIAERPYPGASHATRRTHRPARRVDAQTSDYSSQSRVTATADAALLHHSADTRRRCHQPTIAGPVYRPRRQPPRARRDEST